MGANGETIMIYGHKGWIAGHLQDLLKQQGHILGKNLQVGNARLENRESVAAELDRFKPSRVFCLAGVTGRPNVDWCENNQIETIRANVIGALTLADLCHARKVHLVHFHTGCIFEYDDKHPLGSGIGFKEADKPNFTDSFYSLTKGFLDQMLLSYTDHVCVLRLRMPITDDLSQRNFIAKILKYDKIVDIPNSMSVITDLLPVAIALSERKITGIFNFCNPGVISHNQVLDLYKEVVDPTYTYTNFSLEEQAKVIKAGRSNNELDCHKLLAAVPDIEIPDIVTSVRNVMVRMKENLRKEGVYPDNLWKRGAPVSRL